MEMRYAYQVKIYLCDLLLVIVFMLNGCSIFTPIGNTITKGYDNFVSYFNVYYNASRLFSEAEDEVLASVISKRGKETTTLGSNPQNQIPGSARQKFGQVIDKCSYILAFYSSSSLVDDALMLIGKSFYYQMEYIKAERKFEELIAQYPNSSLILEARLWFAQTEEKLGKYDEGIRFGDLTAAAAHRIGDDLTETQACLLLGTIYNKTNQIDKAIQEYEKSIAISSDDDIKSEAQINLGKIYLSNGKYEKAIEVFLNVKEHTSDIYLNYYCGLQASIALHKSGEYEKEFTFLNAQIEDFRNKEYLSSLYYERANNYAVRGKFDDAISEYVYIDTTYAKTEPAARSAYKLGLLYLTEVAEYSLALKYFLKVKNGAPLDITEDGKRKYSALTKHYEAWKKIFQADSLSKAIQDTTHNTITLTDSLQQENRNADSTKQIADQKVSRPIKITADSINTIKSIAAQELGDVFYSEILVPDSAYYWYNQSLAWDYKNTRSPRVLYVLAEHSRTHPERKYPLPSEYYTRLIRDFPESLYAEEARRFIGADIALNKTDTAAVYFEEAEKQIELNHYLKAINTLKKISLLYPSSHLAAKSEFAIGWIYEHRLAQPESAIVQYKKVAKNYSGTTYSEFAAKRIVEEQTIDTTKNIINNPSSDGINSDRASSSEEKTKVSEDKVDEITVPPKTNDETDNRRRRNPRTPKKDVEDNEK